MMNVKREKFPRIPHLPWSAGKTEDDIFLTSFEHFEQLKDVVVTEKLDGENTTLYHDYLHARSLDSKSHPSRDWIKQFHASLKPDIPQDFRICGENMYAKHGIFYDALTTYFYVFAIFQEDICLSWDETVEWCQLLGLETVPVLCRGKWDEKAIKACWTGKSVFGKEQEGYVVRNAKSFKFEDFQDNIAKYVRANHVTTEQHWMHEAITPNQLAT